MTDFNKTKENIIQWLKNLIEDIQMDEDSESIWKDINRTIDTIELVIALASNAGLVKEVGEKMKYLNIYKDEKGFYTSDCFYDSLESALEFKDGINYVGTAESKATEGFVSVIKEALKKQRENILIEIQSYDMWNYTLDEQQKLWIETAVNSAPEPEDFNEQASW